jgi:hypothetical protein
MNNFSVNRNAETAPKKSFLALDHVFLIAMNVFDANHTQHSMDFFLSTSLLTTSLELEDAHWERILSQIDKALGDLFKMNIKGVAVSCRTDGETMKLSFSDPSYHDLELTHVLIKDGRAQKAQAA